MKIKNINLPWYKWIQAPIAYMKWSIMFSNERIEPFWLALKGNEIHEHNYNIPETISGIKFLKCSHPGCVMYDPS